MDVVLGERKDGEEVLVELWKGARGCHGINERGVRVCLAVYEREAGCRRGVKDI